MKHMKKLASLLLALVMVMGLATTAFAAGETGVITIKNAVVGQTYTVYQILDLESYSDVSSTEKDELGNSTGGNYAYKATSDWKNFIEGNGIKDVYVNVDDQGYVTWKDGASAADFAKAAQKYAADNKLGNQGTKTATAAEGSTDTTTTVSFSGLDLGYYLVDSTLGTLCSLDTTNPNVTIKEKNGQPTNVKTVKEGNSYGSSNDANIGDTVYFQSTITAQAGAENYVFHDKMDSGLTYGSVAGITLNGTAVDTKYYTVETSGLEDTNPCTFHVVFTQAFCDTLNPGDTIVISYTATVNENAVVGGTGNKNESWLKYGENNDLTTTPSETKTYTYKFDLVKTKNDNTLLTGAWFKLYDAKEGGNEIALVKESDGVYRVATATEKSAVGFTAATIEAGKVVIKGLDSGTYYLEETKAPVGYNKLAERIEVTIDKANLDATVNEETNTWTVGGVHVINQTGNELPSTGGMGTTIFYVVGSILLIGAAVLLITKKRMSAEK